MRSYNVPPDVNEKEKIIGGILNINQFFWLLGGLLIGAIVFVLLYPLLDKYSLIVAGLFALSGTPFVLIKPKGLTLYEYLKRKRNFDKKTKYLPNIKKDYEW